MSLFIRFILVLTIGFCCLSVRAAAAGDEIEETNADTLIAKARELQEMGDAESSLRLLDRALEIRSFTPKVTIDQWAEVVNLQAVSYAMKYDWLKAIKTCFAAYRLLLHDPRNSQYAISLYNLATFYAGRGNEKDYERAIAYALVAQEKFDKNTPNYFDCLNNLVYYYLLNNDSEKAMELVKRAIQSGEEAFSSDKRKYAKSLWSKAKATSELEMYHIAIEYGNATLQVMEQNGMASATDYVRRVVSVAGYYYQIRDFAGEIATLEKAIPVAKEVSGGSSREYVDCLRKLALAYNHLANDNRSRKDQKAHDEYRERNEYYEGLARDILIQTNQLEEIRTYQIPLISNKANELFEQGKHDEAIQYEMVAYKLHDMNGNQEEKAHSAGSLSYFYYDNKNLVDALKYGQISTQLYDQIDKVSRNKGLAYSNMSLYCHDAGRVQDAIRYSLSSIKTLEQMNDTLSELYIKALGNTGVYYHEAGDEQNALAYSTRSASVQSAQLAAAERGDTIVVKKGGGFLRKKKTEVIVKRTAAKVDNGTVTVQWNQTVYAANPEEVHDAYSKAIDLQRRVFLQDFPELTVEQRKQEWTKRAFIYDYAETLAFTYPNNDSILTDVYNAMLIKRAMPRYIQQQDSTGILRNWRQVADSLKEGEVLVTFFCTVTDNRGDAYSAILLRQGWSAPKEVHQLFTDYDLKFLEYDEQPFPDAIQTAEGRTAICADPRFARMLWTRILSELGSDIGTIVYDIADSARQKILGILNPARLNIDPDTPLSSKYVLHEP